MEALMLHNQIYTIAYTIIYIPYMIYWSVGFGFNIYCLLCMFNIVYKSNVYNDIMNKKYSNCLTVIVPQILYLYGILTWNPLIICLIILHSSIIGNDISEPFWSALININSKYDTSSYYNTAASEDDIEPVEPEEDKPLSLEDAIEPEEDKPLSLEDAIEPEEDKPLSLEDAIEPEEDKPLSLEDIRAVSDVP